jgi:Flp pilus assembly pilin Flp
VQYIGYAITSLYVRLRSERGQDLLEYALLGGLIAAALIALFTLGAISGGTKSMVENIRDCIDFESTTTCDISLP